jgi:hypothetical protein
VRARPPLSGSSWVAADRLVGAQHLHHPAQSPQRLLYAEQQRLVAFAQRDGRPAPAAEAERQLEQQVIERRARDGDAELITVGEVVGRFAARRMFLGKVHLLVRPVQRPPLSQPALQSAQLARGKTTRMSPIKLAQDGSRFQHSLLIRRQQWHYFALEHLGEWIGPITPPVPLTRLRRVKPRTPLARAAHAHPRACGCRLLPLVFH